MTMAHDLRAGMAVYTMDNERLGEVKEVRGAYFKVDASMEPDYWLGTMLWPTVATRLSGSDSTRTWSANTRSTSPGSPRKYGTAGASQPAG